jgi:hypothetical protein
MSNEQFEDISVLKTLLQLHRDGLLHPNDADILRSRLKTEWAKNAATALLTDDHQGFSEAQSILSRFSAAA